MTEIKAKQVKDLRTQTGAPMMDCKTALMETNGNIDDAIDWLRKRGAQVADKKSGRDATQGLIGIHVRREDDGMLYGAVVEVNCETDFVAKNEVFQNFVSNWAMRCTVVGNMSSEELNNLISKVGENIKLGSIATMKGGSVMASYVHNKVAGDLGSIGVLITLDGEPSEELASVAYEIAMHIAATNPRSIDESSLDSDWLAHERQIFVDQAKESGKPDNIIEKMVDGRMKKVIRENTLIHQSFVKDADKTVADILEENDATVTGFVRIAVGE